MRRSSSHRSQSGFSLIEILIVFVVLVVIAAVGIPALQQLMLRSKLTGAAQEVATHVLQSRLEAMKMMRPVVVAPDYASLSVVSWIENSTNPMNLVFDAGVDDELYRLPVPGDSGNAGLFFMGPVDPPGTELAPLDSVEGLTPVPNTPRFVIVFERDGSVRDPGALRISDNRGDQRNVLEVRVAPQATARIEVRKYIYDDDAYRGYGAGLWEWY